MDDLLFGLLLATGLCAVLALLVAVFLRLSAHWATRTDMTFGDAYKTSLVGLLANLVLALLLGLMVAATGFGVLQILMIPIGFLVMSFVISSRFALPFLPSMLTTLLTTVLSVVSVGVIFLALLLVGVLFGAK